MLVLLALHTRVCDSAIWLCLRIAVAIEDHRRWLTRSHRRLVGSLRRLLRRFEPPRFYPPPSKVAWNRTPAAIEEKVVRLHIEHPQLGVGQLRRLAHRVLAFRAARETIRKILIRRRDLIAELEDARREPKRRILVRRPRLLWGVDLTLVWLLGFFPIWLVGIVDYHGSRVVALERVLWPTTAQVAHVVGRAFDTHGSPARMISDRGPAFTSFAFGAFLVDRGVEHTLIRPAHPWTNGRIERLFATFKQTVSIHRWLWSSVQQIDRWCADFVVFHNRDRPHEANGGLTPDEVHAGITRPRPSRAQITYFDGRMAWYRFG